MDGFVGRSKVLAFILNAMGTTGVTSSAAVESRGAGGEPSEDTVTVREIPLRIHPGVSNGGHRRLSEVCVRW